MNRDYLVQAPSNIALIKYWGKRNASQQWPANDSLSMTLNHSRTMTKIRPRPSVEKGFTEEYAGSAGSNESLDLFKLLNPRSGAETARSDFFHKSRHHLQTLRRELCQVKPSLRSDLVPLLVETRNTFPADCGIASSASGMAALTLGALAVWTGATNLPELEAAGFCRGVLATMARKGSGSACRSLHGGFVWWRAGGSHEEQQVTQLEAEDHWPLADTIVLVSRAPKTVSSSEGHKAAWTSPLFDVRLADLQMRLAQARSAIRDRDLEALGGILEQEALEMHAVMMTATPPATYLSDGTRRVLCWVRRERQAGRLPAYFTLDAGPNVHLISTRDDQHVVAERVRAAFPSYSVIIDGVGSGPSLSLSDHPESSWAPLDHV